MSEPTLDDVLAGETGEVESEANAEPETEVTPTEPEETKEPEGSEETNEPEDKPKEEKQPPSIEEFKGMLDEREKRQKAQAEVEQRDRRIAELEAKIEPEKRADPIEDPEGFNAQVEARFRQLEVSFERKLIASQHADWPQAEEWINSQIKDKNAAMITLLSQSDSAFQDAYKMYQDHLKLEEMGNVDDLRAKIREEERAKLLEEQSTKDSETKASEESTNAAINKVSAVTKGTTESAGHTGDLSLEDIIGGDARSRPA